MTLAPAGGSRRTRDVISRVKLAAPNLSGGDVDVALALLEALEPEEPVAGAGELEDPRDLLGLLVRFRLGLAARAPARRLILQALAATATTATTATAAAARLRLVAASLLDLGDEGLALQLAIAGHPELGGALVELREVEISERGHGRASLFEAF